MSCCSTSKILPSTDPLHPAGDGWGRPSITSASSRPLNMCLPKEVRQTPWPVVTLQGVSRMHIIQNDHHSPQEEEEEEEEQRAQGMQVLHINTY